LLLLAFAIAVSLLVATPATEAAYSYQAGSNTTCTGGNTTGPTIGQALKSRALQVYAALSPAQQTFFNNVYPGTVCHTRVTGSHAILGLPKGTSGGLPSPTLDPTFSTQPWGYCQPVTSSGAVLGSDAYPSCVGGSATLDVSVLNFGYYQFNGTAQLENDVYYPGDTPGWQAPTNYSFHDSNGNVWGMSVSNYTQGYPDGHTGYGTEAAGSGSYFFGPICGINGPPPTDINGIISDLMQCSPTTVVQAAGEQVHIGFASTSTPFQDPTYYFPAYYWCWFGDFGLFNSNSGYCANP